MGELRWVSDDVMAFHCRALKACCDDLAVASRCYGVKAYKYQYVDFGF